MLTKTNEIPIYGIDKELAAKAAAKYDPQKETQARTWIEEVICEQSPSGASFQEWLKDGIVLC
ncbi:hypothetical protein HK102_007311, partial [Quaeritorhiza haematococci]